MKVMITVQEAVERGVWFELMELFGRSAEDDIWPNEQFILTEAQARKLGLLGVPATAAPDSREAQREGQREGQREALRRAASRGDVPPGVDTGLESGRPH
ncbi:hypothetical protein MO973_00715 [Paenibacillus sp. TRM 82003]|nr:hypothetical protein [Paenibacillus sp. TRM 82003]